MEAAFDRIAAELEAGEVVCIFPEGRDHQGRAAESLPPGRGKDRAAHAGARGADGDRRHVGQLLQPQGRAGDAAAVSPRLVKIQVVIGAPVAPALATAPALEAAVLDLRGDAC